MESKHNTGGLDSGPQWTAISLTHVQYHKGEWQSLMQNNSKRDTEHIHCYTLQETDYENVHLSRFGGWDVQDGMVLIRLNESIYLHSVDGIFFF